MIVQKYPSVRLTVAPPPAPKEDRHPNAPDRSRALAFGISPEEFVRRDNIVRQMYLDCLFNIGDTCEPVDVYAQNKYGKCIIRKIFRTYHDFPIMQAKDWPKDDRPLIVTAEPEKKPEESNLILCTPKFLQKYYGSSCS